jgi:hypothetical protein
MTEGYLGLSPEEQLFKLGHEIAHSMQWDQGSITFALRYALEAANFPAQQQYYLTERLRNTPLSEIDMDTSLFKRMQYSLDELADRIGYEVSPVGTERLWRDRPGVPKLLSAYGYQEREDG